MKQLHFFLSKVADTMVMGLVTLATFSATYLLAWGQPGTNCIPMLNNTTSNNTGSSDDGLKNPTRSGQQILFGLLPFVILPITLFLSGLAKIAETDKRALSFVSASCFCEFTLAIALGGVMSYCMMGAQIYWVLCMTTALIVAMGVIWILTFRYPKCVSFHRSDVAKDMTAVPVQEPTDTSGADDESPLPQPTVSEPVPAHASGAGDGPDIQPAEGT